MSFCFCDLEIRCTILFQFLDNNVWIWLGVCKMCIPSVVGPWSLNACTFGRLVWQSWPASLYLLRLGLSSLHESMHDQCNKNITKQHKHWIDSMDLRVQLINNHESIFDFTVCTRNERLRKNLCMGVVASRFWVDFALEVPGCLSSPDARNVFSWWDQINRRIAKLIPIT